MTMLKKIFGLLAGVFVFILDCLDHENDQADKESYEDLRLSKSPEHRELVVGNIEGSYDD